MQKYTDMLNQHMMSKKRRLSDIVRALTDEGKYVARLKSFRWKNEVECLFCGINYVREFRDSTRFKCGVCKKMFSITVGTPFQGSRLPLRKWFKTIELLQQDVNTSSVKVAQKIKVTQKTAWFMIQRLKTHEDGRYLGIEVDINTQETNDSNGK